MNKEYFFCYSKVLHNFIQNRHKINYVCAGLHETTYKKFWLYERSERLTVALNEYKQIFKMNE
jgi:hypothetical protein